MIRSLIHGATVGLAVSVGLALSGCVQPPDGDAAPRISAEAKGALFLSFVSSIRGATRPG